MTRRPGELPEAEEALLGIERPTPEQEAEQQQRAKDEKALRELFLKDLMSRPLFRAWLMDWLVQFETFGNPFGVSPAGMPDADATQFRLGMKAAGWSLWEQFDDLVPDLASLMRREWKERI